MAESGWQRSSTSAFRWIRVSFSLPTSFMRWPRLFTSYFTPNWSHRSDDNGVVSSSSSFLWESISYAFSPRQWSWPDLDVPINIVDSIVWSVISAVESVALVSMLCFFFLFCGCTF
ncbi:hypothetical protein P3S67_019079 [Capsicum chacoense]|uniref:uncharacterized protein LOC107879831 n=1 Tax=Capsicum annuum TaxID=4072 RepID=UPI0007BFA78C|nr:uncharacterized protein LOC107879831 [Capsicum annuum]